MVRTMVCGSLQKSRYLAKNKIVTKYFLEKQVWKSVRIRVIVGCGTKKIEENAAILENRIDDAALYIRM